MSLAAARTGGTTTINWSGGPSLVRIFNHLNQQLCEGGSNGLCAPAAGNAPQGTTVTARDGSNNTLKSTTVQ